MANTPPADFLTIAEQQGLLPTQTFHELTAEVAERGIDPATLVLQKGLMSPMQVEIVETLRQPTNAIPGYQVQSVIGYGGMGVVYRARQLNLDRTVALKTILVNLASNPTMLARFEQEAQTVARLLHPHIIAAYDFGRHAGRLYFAMEYVEGEDAEHFATRKHPLSERVVWGLIRQAAAGLAHAAELGIVHRDIKPANLLLVTPPKGYPIASGMPMVKIADFGLAFLAHEVNDRTRLTAEQTTIGSPHYMAPEQLDASKPVDFRADIYSLGATAYHLLTGHPPFRDQTLPQIIARKLSDERPAIVDARSDISPEGVALLNDLLARDPEKRINSYVELFSRIDSLPVVTAYDSATLAWRSTSANTIATANPFTPRHIAVGVATAALATGLIVFGLGFLSNNTPPPITTPAKSLATGDWGAALFDGRSLKGWSVVRGTWIIVQDDEGSTILSGTEGEIRRSFARAINGQPAPVENYRLLTTVRLREASAIEMQFGFESDGGRQALRFTLDRVAVGHRDNDRAPLIVHSPAKPYDVGADRLHELKVERQATEWRVFVDDEQIAAIPFAADHHRPELSLVAEGGPAWFADMMVEELVSK